MSVRSPNPVIASPRVLDLLDHLHGLSTFQEAQITSESYRQKDGFDDLMRDKFIALDQDKCWFVYQLLLSNRSRYVVEAGTSFGVSTIYLSLAVSQNLKSLGLDASQGKIIATENEATKAIRAKEWWNQAGKDVEELIDLRQGDLRETLKTHLPEKIDLLLLDIWCPLALPTLQLVQPNLHSGSVVIIDNIVGSADRYKDLIEYLRDGKNDFRNLTIPYNKGLGMSVYMGKR
ncbi:uncharacterized protein IL334_000524 [Kwoniella shivajii]|uniref:O-methyltransferase n=1 Tax=Kwoniella shivajii TaxID=564305 RepID=A0ABZ1CPM9_9TREE|nr:hypothetical protein IL334_000524 [Kwoniella shivajii]